MRSRRLRRGLLLAALLLTPLAVAAEQDRIFFSRSFPGSVPEYFDVTVAADGKAVYREAVDDEFPVDFTLPKDQVETVFELAERLDRFRGDLASKRKVAFTGDKVLRYEAAEGAGGEAKFHYTEDETARELLVWFARIGETERIFVELERVIQFDRLGVNKTLLNLQSAYNKGRVIAPRQFLPILSKINADKKIMHLARSRAAGLIESIERGD